MVGPILFFAMPSVIVAQKHNDYLRELEERSEPTFPVCKKDSFFFFSHTFQDVVVGCRLTDINNASEFCGTAAFNAGTRARCIVGREVASHWA